MTSLLFVLLAAGCSIQDEEAPTEADGAEDALVVQAAPAPSHEPASEARSRHSGAGGPGAGDDDAVTANGSEQERPPEAEGAASGDGTRTYERNGATKTLPRSVVQCAVGVPPGVGSPISPQWVSFSDRMLAEDEDLSEDCTIGTSDVVLQKVNMGEGEDGRLECGVGMSGSLTTTFQHGYAGASAATVEKTLSEFRRIQLQTRGDGKLYRIEFLMKEQLQLQCGDSGLNPYGMEFRCGTGDATTIIEHSISLDGLSQQLTQGGRPWGKRLEWDADAVQRVQIRPVNRKGSAFGFDCEFRLDWIEPR